MAEQDRHHILHARYSWDSRPEGRSLRATPLLIPLIPRWTHENIHSSTPAVPLLPLNSLQQVRNNFKCGRDTLSSMDNLMMTIEQATKHRKAHDLEKDLCWLAIRAIELQKPYIKQGIANVNRNEGRYNGW